MRVVLLAGGEGTRMREETAVRPKPMVEVGGKPVLWHIMERYIHFGHSDFIVCLGYLGNYIKHWFLDFEAMSHDLSLTFGAHDRQHIFHNPQHRPEFTVTLANTGGESMTGARVKRVQKYVNNDRFMVTYGDGLSDVDIERLVEFHKSHGKLATLTTARASSRFGILNINDDGRVDSFTEKPQLDGWINAGYFVFENKVFDYLNEDASCVLEQEPLRRLAADGQLMAFRHEGFFFPMDTYKELQALNAMWDAGKAPWQLPRPVAVGS